MWVEPEKISDNKNREKEKESPLGVYYSIYTTNISSPTVD